MIGPDASPPAQLEAQPDAGRAPRDWSVWLLPLSALMLFAGAVGIYYLPADLDLLLPLRVWVCAAVAPLALVAYRTMPMLRSPSNNVITYKRDGTPIIHNRFTALLALLIIAIIAAAYAIVRLLGPFGSFNLSSFHDIDDLIGDPFVYLSFSCAVTALLSIVWLVRVKPLSRALQLRFADLALAVVVVAGYLALISWLPGLLNPASVPGGPFASWPTLVQFARHQANAIDKDAVVEQVEAAPAYNARPPYSPWTTAFEIDFTFLSANGQDIVIGLSDTDPPRIISIDTFSYSGAPALIDTLKEYASRFSYAKLGPREVYSLTEQEGLAFAREKGITTPPGVGMTISPNSPSLSGLAPAWNISYIVGKPRLILSGTYVLFLDLEVDSATGKVLNLGESEDPDTIPAPTPGPTTSPTPLP